MKFTLSRLGGVFALGALTLLSGSIAVPSACAQATGTQQAAAGQTTPNYKDRGEYDLFNQIANEKDPAARLKELQTWTDKYPQTDFAKQRLQYYLVTLNQLAPNNPDARKQLLDKAQEGLKLDPTNFTANYFVTTWGPSVPNPTPDQLTQVDTAAHAMLDSIDTQFADKNKPANMSADQWTQAKAVATSLAHNTLAWEATQKKDFAGAEDQYKASLTANPNQANVSYQYAKLLMDQKKYPQALFEYARAGNYDGPGALPASARTQVQAYFTKVYAEYHGSADGADAVVAQAKTAALPPDSLNITGQADLENARIKKLEDRMNSDPAFKLWYTVETSLKDQGDTFFDSNVKDTEIPGGANGVKNFTGTVISIDPPDHPTTVKLGIDDPQTADATLLFSKPLPTSALDKIKVGQTIDFSGVADSYAKDPYMLTFKDPTIPGVETTPAPAKKPVRRRPGTNH